MTGLSELSIKELKALLVTLGINYANCFEKSDLVQLLIDTNINHQPSTTVSADLLRSPPLCILPMASSTSKLSEITSPSSSAIRILGLPVDIIRIIIGYHPHFIKYKRYYYMKPCIESYSTIYQSIEDTISQKRPKFIRRGTPCVKINAGLGAGGLGVGVHLGSAPDEEDDIEDECALHNESLTSQLLLLRSSNLQRGIPITFQKFQKFTQYGTVNIRLRNKEILHMVDVDYKNNWRRSNYLTSLEYT